MAQRSQPDPQDVLARIGAAWGWVLIFGVLTLLLGFLAVVWPGRTVVVIAVLLGLELIIVGIFRFVEAFAYDEATGGTRVLMALLGILSFIVGIYATRHVGVTVGALALVLGIYWVVHGFIELFSAISDRDMNGRGWAMFTGVLSIVAGTVVLIQPHISLAVLAWVLGIWLIVYGAIMIYTAFRLRSVRQLAHGR
jgi:uncharacterized membrane protein HdeD (DUF308 family)